MENSSARSPAGKGVVERQDRVLVVVQRFLRERGIRSRCHHVISLGLSAVRQDGAGSVGPPGPSFWLERFPPELVVAGSGGRCEVTVTVEERSGAYLLSLPGGSALQGIRETEPGKVADLIAGALGAAR